LLRSFQEEKLYVLVPQSITDYGLRVKTTYRPCRGAVKCNHDDLVGYLFDDEYRRGWDILEGIKGKKPASPQREARTRGLIFSESMLILASRCGLAGPYGMAVVRKTRSPQMMGVECPLPGKNHDGHALILGPGQKAKDALDIESTIRHPQSRHRSGDADETMVGHAFIIMEK